MKPLYVIIIAIIVAAIAFYGGMLYQKNQTRASFASGANGQFGFRRFGGGAGGPGGAGMMPVRGQIVSSGNNSITVKMQDGSSKIVNLTSQTQITTATKGTQSDLKSGTTVTAIGSTNSDGSITAQNVLIGNGNMMFRRPGGGQGAPTGSQQSGSGY